MKIDLGFGRGSLVVLRFQANGFFIDERRAKAGYWVRAEVES